MPRPHIMPHPHVPFHINMYHFPHRCWESTGHFAWLSPTPSPSTPLLLTCWSSCPSSRILCSPQPEGVEPAVTSPVPKKKGFCQATSRAVPSACLWELGRQEEMRKLSPQPRPVSVTLVVTQHKRSRLAQCGLCPKDKLLFHQPISLESSGRPLTLSSHPRKERAASY